MRHRVPRLLLSAMLLHAILFFVPPVRAADFRPLIERQEIDVSLDPDHHLLNGESTLVIAGGGAVTLSIASDAVIDRVEAAGHELRHTRVGTTLSVELPHPGEQAIRLTVAYHATFSDPLPTRSASGEDPTYGVTGTITPRGVFLNSSAGWYPVPSAPPVRRRVTISAPAGIEAVTAGRLLVRTTASGRTSSTWEEEHPVEQLALSAGPYLVEERRFGAISLYTYLYPDSAGLSGRYLDAAATALRHYEELFGPYPFEKFAVVENFFPTGYGFPSYTLLGSTVIRLPFIADTSLPHEIAHSWWGNGVLVDEEGGNWSEGLVTYLADYLLKERRSVAEGRDYRRRLLSDYAVLVPPGRDMPLRAFYSRTDPASRAIGYGKGAMLFHMVRTRIGDAAFFAALRDICRDRMYRQASWRDLADAFSRRAGTDLAPFMEQWLSRPGGPQFSLADVTFRPSSTGWEVTGAIVQDPAFAGLSVPLRLETDGAAVAGSVMVEGERTPFRLAAADRPRRLLLDPDAELFRRMSADELPPTVNRIKGATQLLLVRTADCRADDATLRNLLESLGQGAARIVPEQAAGTAGAGDNDILFCGMPRSMPLPPLPAEMAVDSGSFSVSGERFSGNDSLLFLAARYPGGGKRASGLFLPLSSGAASRYALKITHYGSYGYLVFSGGAIRRTGVFPPVSSRTAVLFDDGDVPKGPDPPRHDRR